MEQYRADQLLDVLANSRSSAQLAAPSLALSGADLQVRYSVTFDAEQLREWRVDEAEHVELEAALFAAAPPLSEREQRRVSAGGTAVPEAPLVDPLLQKAAGEYKYRDVTDRSAPLHRVALSTANAAGSPRHLTGALAFATGALTANASYVVALRARKRSLPPGPAHHQARCDACGSMIVGFRHKCTSCPDFDLCAGCYAAPDTLEEHGRDHAFRTIERPPEPPAQHRAVCDMCRARVIGIRHHCKSVSIFCLWIFRWSNISPFDCISARTLICVTSVGVTQRLEILIRQCMNSTTSKDHPSQKDHFL